MDKLDKYLEEISDQYVIHKDIEDWGISIHLVRRNGSAFSRVYWFYDDLDNIYLSSLSVHENCRKAGIGTEMQEIREEIGRILNFKTSSLEAKDGEWMADWYARRGYKKITDESNKEGYSWMEKKL